MTTYTEKDYTLAYERKRESSIKRNIEFELTLEEYTAIMKARPNLTCGYTGKPFNMKSSSHKDYPELDRLCPNSPYSKGNILFVRRCVHKLKTDYIENQRSRKGLGHQNVCMLRSVEKVLNQPNVLEEALKPYHDIYTKVEERMKELSEREVKQERISKEQEKQQTLTEIRNKIKTQAEQAKHYLDISKGIEAMGLVYNVTTREHRDRFRIQSDALTKEPFKQHGDKFMWIPNQKEVLEKGWVGKDDFVVVHAETTKLVDSLRNTGNMKLTMLNALKHL